MAELRVSERRARQSEEVLVVANRLERLVVDLENGQRGFVITGQERFLEPWKEGRDAFPAEAATLERLVAGSPEQQARAQRITQATTSYLRDYSVPLVASARRDPAAARTEGATDEGKRRMDAIRGEFDRFLTAERGLAAEREQRSDAADRLAGGDLGVRMDEQGVGEIGVLERSFNRLPEPVEVAAYHVVSEALANAAKHAQASVAQVEASARDGRLRLSVRDDGVGGASPGEGSGLVGLADRVEALGGTIRVDSPAGRGTSLQIDLPIHPGDRPSGQ